MKKKWKLVAGIAVAGLCMLAGLKQKTVPEDFGLIYTEEEQILSEEKTAENTQTPENSGAEDLQEDDGQKYHNEAQPADKEKLVIHICGAVQSPGVYFLEEGSRLYQAVDAAGGFKKDAGEEYLNLADILSDGEKIYIPTIQEAKEEMLSKETKEDGVTESVSDSKVNINTASAEMLCTLPGIGSSKAESIISYREIYGAFEETEDIMKVEGIKDGLFRKIKDKITV